LWLVLGAAFAVRLIVLLQLQAHPLLQPRGDLDPGVYLDLARQVAAGDLLAPHRVFFVSPLYIYFLAGILALSGGSIFAVQVVQVALGVACVGLIGLTARLWFGERGWGIAAALAALTGHFAFNEILILQSALDPFLTALGLWLLARAWLHGGRRMFFAAGVVLGLHVLNRPNMAAWALVAVVLTLAGPMVIRVARPAGSGWRRAPTGGLAPALRLAGGLAVALAPVAAHNYAVARQVALVSSHGGLNFYIGNNAEADGTYHLVAGITPSIAGQDRDMRQVAERAKGRTLSDVEASSWFYGQAWSWIRSRPGDAVRLFARKIVYVFNAADLPLNFSYAYYSRDEATLLRVLVIGPWLLLPLGLSGLWLGRPGGDPSGTAGLAWWRWAAFVPVYGVAVAVFFVAGRYRLPLLVALSVTSAGAALALWDRWRAARWAPLVTGAGLVAILAIPVNLDLGLDNGLSGERAEMILHDIDTGQDAAAMSLLARAEPEDSERALLLYRVGEAYLNRHDAARAAPLLERALAAEPGRPETHLALGQALLDLGRAAEAIPHLRTALQARVRGDVAAFDLARALSATGATAEAIAALRGIPSPDGLDAASQLAVGRLALDLGDAALAEAFLRRAVTGASGDAAARESLGLALAQLGRRPEAVAALEMACQLDQASPTARLNLAVLYAESGRIPEARQRAEEALRLWPDYTRARDFLKALGREGKEGRRGR
jgi:tetratricopeptide (TPR) repeat protein